MSKWSGAQVAVLGGEIRELEVIRNYLAAGCKVRTYGIIPNDQYGALEAGSVLEAVRGADVIVAPVPGVGPNDTLYGPHSPTPIQITGEVFAAAKRGAFYFAGRATKTMKAAGAEYGVRFLDLGDDDHLQVLHAIPTAEGAIAITVKETDHTIHNADALVVGYGRIATLLARDLRGLGARRVTVAARRPEVRVRAFADGNAETGTSAAELIAAVKDADLIYTTVPAPLLDREVLSHVRKGVLVMDLASPPGGMDHEAGRELGLKVVWARAQAGTAPRHSGHAQFLCQARVLDEEFGQ